METKICSNCHESRPISDFYGRNSTWCRPCRLKAAEINRRSLGIPSKRINFVNDGERKCTGCGRILPFSSFYTRKDRGSDNVTKSECKECIRKKREIYRRSKGMQHYSKNVDCSQYLGVHIGEDMIADTLLRGHYDNVVHMPFGTVGHDFVVDGGIKIDVKTRSRTDRNGGGYGWVFEVDRNKIADYFLFIALSDRDGLILDHVWIIPGHKVNSQKYATVSESCVDKWRKFEYELRR